MTDTPEKETAEDAQRSGGIDIGSEQTTIGGDVTGRDKVAGDKVEGDKIEVGNTGAGSAVAAGEGASASVTNIYQAAVPIATSLHQLPPPPRDFTGREDELNELMSKAEGEGVTISGLHGMGGVGKTALALVVAERLKTRYPDAQFYLDLKGASKEPLSVSQVLAHVIRAYHPTAQLPASESELLALYHTVLNAKRALLLMDNAADGWQVEPLLPPTSCFLLVTSRQHFTLPGLHAKNLDKLPANDARDLLLKIAPRIKDHADEIAKLCGYLPLALRLAGSALAERVTLTVESYIRRLSDAQGRLQLIDASLSLSYDLLEQDLQRAWCALSVFPETFDLAAAAAVWDAEGATTQDQLDTLVRYSMVEWDATATRARLHDLARVFADARLDDVESATAQRRHAQYFKNLLSEADDLYLQGNENVLRGLALFDLERANIETAQDWSITYAQMDDDAARLCHDYPNVGAYVLDLRLPQREMIRWLEAALAAARRLNNKKREGSALGNLGIAYKNLGDMRRAIEFYEQWLSITRAIGDWRGEGAVLGNLGSAYAALGETRRAIEYHEEALVIARELGDKRAEGSVLGNLGVTYAALGETRRAIEFYEQQLLIAREIGDRRGEGNALSNLGVAYKNLGETRRAIEFYEQRLVIAREIGDRRGEATDMWNMSLALDKLGERARAIECAAAAFKIYEAIEDPNAGMVRRHLAEWRGEKQQTRGLRGLLAKLRGSHV